MTADNNEIKIAISDTCLDSLSKLPGQAREKTWNFIKKFRANPKGNGINYEKIHDASDPNMRSVRIDHCYRGIVYKPPAGNVYLLLWIDTHDEAYQWAKRTKCGINPHLGCIQIWSTNAETMLPADDIAPSPTSLPLFCGFSERKLLNLGIPTDAIESVKKFTNRNQLALMRSAIPETALIALEWLANGDSYEDVYSALITPIEEKINPEDFSKALEHMDSKRSFFTIENEAELEAMFNAPLEKWRVFLHPSQRKLVEKEWNGPVRVLGGAGTGKTVAALHRAKWLAKKYIEHNTPIDRKILFTTFTKNLALDIQQNLEKICTPRELERIEVINLDSWVVGFLKKHGYSYRIHYPQSTNDPYWEEALNLRPHDTDLPLSFYKEEWEQIISPYGIQTRDEYLKISRIGRGTPVSRQLRMKVWLVFEEYRHILSRENLKEREDAFRDAKEIMEKSPIPLPYHSIIVDEGQDMGMAGYHLLAQILNAQEKSNSLFIVGDPHQRIYKRKVVLGRCGIDIRGRGKKLKINYRTTEENRDWAVSLLKGMEFDDLNGERDNQDGYVSLMHGAHPQVKAFDSFEDELKAIMGFIKNVQREGSSTSTCLVTRISKQLEQYKYYLNQNGIETFVIDHSKVDDRSRLGIRLATMHRVKGLEFDNIIIAGANEGIIPLMTDEAQSDDNAIREEHHKLERSLLYVAATRAKKNLIVTGYKKLSPFLLN